MRLRDGVFGGGIAGLSLFWADLALAGDAALQLRLHFGTASLFEWIGASTGDQHAADRDQDRQGPHPFILRMKRTKANRQD